MGRLGRGDNQFEIEIYIYIFKKWEQNEQYNF